MKDLKTLLETSLLSDIEDTIKSGNKFENFSLNTIMSVKSVEEFNSYVKMLKIIIESSCKGPISHKQLKKGKAYIYVWKDSWSDDDSYAISFVDKYPIQDKNIDYIDDAFYTICWVSNRQFTGVKCNYDDTGNSFTDLLQQDFGKDTMEGAYEIPNEYLKDIKNIMKNADRW